MTLADYGGFPMFVAIWALAIAGILFELIGRERQPKWVTILIYLIMGWLVVLRLPQLLHALNPIGIGLLLAGGLCYTAGTAFYVAKRIRYMHSVWHLWVLAGSVLQFMAVILLRHPATSPLCFALAPRAAQPATGLRHPVSALDSMLAPRGQRPAHPLFATALLEV